MIFEVTRTVIYEIEVPDELEDAAIDAYIDDVIDDTMPVEDDWEAVYIEVGEPCATSK